jgi:hypothetical protein
MKMKTLLGLFGFATLAAAQMSFIGAGANISVRTNETLSVRRADGRVFLGVVERDVIDERGAVAIPRGSRAELIVTNVSRQVVSIDLESVVVNGQRFAVAANPDRVRNTDQNMWRNGRNAEYVDGGNGRRIVRSSVLNFRLEQPLRMGIEDNGHNRNGVHYHDQYRSR